MSAARELALRHGLGAVTLQRVAWAVREIPTPVSLGVIIAVLAVVTVASLIKTRRDPTAKAHPGSLRAHPTKNRHPDQDHPAAH